MAAASANSSANSTTNHCNRWTKEDEEMAKKLCLRYGQTTDQIAKTMGRTKSAVENKLYALSSCKSKRNKYKKLKSTMSDFGSLNESESAYFAYTTSPTDEPNAEYWCCKCTNDVNVGDELILCSQCGNALSHWYCYDPINEEDHRCARCQYSVHFDQPQNPDREWGEEDNIRLIVLCSEGISTEEISKSMNKPLSEINQRTQALVAANRLPLKFGKCIENERKKTKKRKKHKKRKKKQTKSTRHNKQRWTSKEDKRLLSLCESVVGNVSKKERVRQIIKEYNKKSKVSRTEAALRKQYSKLTKNNESSESSSSDIESNEEDGYAPIGNYNLRSHTKKNKVNKKRSMDRPQRKGRKNPNWTSKDDEALLRLFNGQNKFTTKDFKEKVDEFNATADHERTWKGMQQHFDSLVAKMKKEQKKKRRSSKEEADDDNDASENDIHDNLESVMGVYDNNKINCNPLWESDEEGSNQHKAKRNRNRKRKLNQSTLNQRRIKRKKMEWNDVAFSDDSDCQIIEKPIKTENHLNDRKMNTKENKDQSPLNIGNRPMSFGCNENTKRRRLNESAINMDTPVVIEAVNNDETNAVKTWLTNTVKLPQYFDIFMDKGYDDMHTIEHALTDENLVEIGVKKIGHRRKLMLFVQKLKENSNQNMTELC